MLLVLPLALMAWDARSAFWRRILGLAVIPGALVGYFVFLGLHGLDPLGPIRGEAAFGRVSAGPLGTVVFAFRSARGRGVVVDRWAGVDLLAVDSRAALHRRGEH